MANDPSTYRTLWAGIGLAVVAISFGVAVYTFGLTPSKHLPPSQPVSAPLFAVPAALTGPGDRPIVAPSAAADRLRD